MKTTEEILSEIMEKGIITEKQINLIKNRSNAAQKDLFDYSITDEKEIELEDSQVQKGIEWIKRTQLKTNGEPRTNCVLGYREIDILKSKEIHGYFKGFYDGGNGYYHTYLPIYMLNGMEYFVSGGLLKIIG